MRFRITKGCCEIGAWLVYHFKIELEEKERNKKKCVGNLGKFVKLWFLKYSDMKKQL